MISKGSSTGQVRAWSLCAQMRHITSLNMRSVTQKSKLLLSGLLVCSSTFSGSLAARFADLRGAFVSISAAIGRLPARLVWFTSHHSGKTAGAQAALAFTEPQCAGDCSGAPLLSKRYLRNRTPNLTTTSELTHSTTTRVCRPFTLSHIEPHRSRPPPCPVKRTEPFHKARARTLRASSAISSATRSLSSSTQASSTRVRKGISASVHVARCVLDKIEFFTDQPRT